MTDTPTTTPAPSQAGRAARRDARHPGVVRWHPRGRRRHGRPVPGRGRRSRRGQWRREVDADPHALRRPPRRLGPDPHQRRARHHPLPARRAEVRGRDDLPEARAGRQHRRGGKRLPRARAPHPHRRARRLGDGVSDPEGDAAAEPEVQEPQDRRQVALGRAAPIGGHRQGGLLQRQDPHHGRADRSPRARPRRIKSATWSRS